jgi:hypothetical protein
MDAALLCVRGKMLGVTQFHSQKQAKEYIVDRIVAEAEREGVPLSEIERKMLYFSETDWAPPGMLDVNAEFERDYDDTAYEQKIAGLVRNLEARATREEQERWGDALIKLSEGDHYLQVLIDYDSILPGSEHPGSSKLALWLPATDAPMKRPPGDLRRLILVGLGFGALIMIALAIAAMVR